MDAGGPRDALRDAGTHRLVGGGDRLRRGGGWYPPGEVEKILRQGGLETFQRLREQGKVRFLGLTAEGPSGGVSELIASDAFDVLQCRYNLLNQQTCDTINEAGIIREARARQMGVVTMRMLTSGIFQKLFRQAFPQLGTLPIDRFLLNF